jgi:hypothetical protein
MKRRVERAREKDSKGKRQKMTKTRREKDSKGKRKQG